MNEYRLYPDQDVPYVSTLDFHKDRARACHLEEAAHRPRLDKAAHMVRCAAESIHADGTLIATVSDLGCGDGGLLSLFKDDPGIYAWGYDFMPANPTGWAERGVKAKLLDVFSTQSSEVQFGQISVCTEVLEHLAYPHDTLNWIHEYSDFIVASSPWTENDSSHDECHAWAWNLVVYRKLFTDAHWKIVHHETVGNFQVVLAKS